MSQMPYTPLAEIASSTQEEFKNIRSVNKNYSGQRINKIHNVQFSSCDLSFSDMSASTLEYVTAENQTTLEQINLNNTRIDWLTTDKSTKLRNAQITNAKISNSSIAGDITGVDWSGTFFENTDLRSATCHCDLAGVWDNVYFDEKSKLPRFVWLNHEANFFSRSNESTTFKITRKIFNNELKNTGALLQDTDDSSEYVKAEFINHSPHLPNSKLKNLLILTGSLACTLVAIGLTYGIDYAHCHMHYDYDLKIHDLLNQHAEAMKLTAAMLAAAIGLLILFSWWCYLHPSNNIEPVLAGDEQIGSVSNP